MKLHLPSPLRAVLLASLAFSSFVSAETYLAEGINAVKITNSTHFYDGGKGYYWNRETLKASATALLKQTGSYQYLGDLYDYVPSEYRGAQTTYAEEAFAGLTDDANTCWAYCAANLIQYWQSYYGVFCSQQDQIYHGYTYDKEYLEDLGGTQSLKLNMFIYDNWLNQGGNIAYLAPWYFGGAVLEPERLRENAVEAGFFREYFTGSAIFDYVDYNNIGTNTSLATFSELLAQALGYTRSQEDGADGYKLTEKGLIAGLTIVANENADAGHGITCYGFDTDGEGNVVSLRVANSDDESYELFTLYVKQVGGAYQLYSDAACTSLWKYASLTWHITAVANIKTPASLRSMMAEYSDVSKPLYWNGHLGRWLNIAESAVPDAISTVETGWEAAAGTGTEHAGRFAIDYDSNRPVVFDDRAKENGTTISVATHIVTPGMTVSNSEKDYTFVGRARSLTTGSLLKEGSKNLVFDSVSFTGDTVDITGGWMLLTNGTSMKGGSITLAPAEGSFAGMRFDGATANLSAALTVREGATLDIACDTSMSLSDLHVDDGATLSMTVGSGNATSALLSVTGNMSVEGLISLTFNVTDLDAAESYTLATVSGTLDVADISNMTIQGAAFDVSDYTAELALSDDGKSLYLELADAVVFYWEGGNSSWDKSSAAWSTLDESTANLQAYEDGAHARFTNGTATIEVAEEVQARRLLVENGSYTFTGADRIHVSSEIVLNNGGILALDKAPTLGSNVSLEIADAASSLTVNSGSLSLKALSSKGALTLENGDLTLTSAVTEGGTVNVSGKVSLAKKTTNSFTALTAGSLSLGTGATVAVSGELSAGTISLDTLDARADITAGSLTSAALDIELSAKAQQELGALGLLHGRSVALMNLGTTSSAALSVGSAPLINVGDYDYAIGMSGKDVVLTAALHGVVEWTSSDGVWSGDDDWNNNTPTTLAGLLGQGTSTVRLSGTKSVGKFVVEAPKDYSLEGDGVLKAEALTVNDGTLRVGNELVVVSDAVSVGKEGGLEVEQGSTLQAGSMVLHADDAFANAGTVTVTGALEAQGYAIRNTGMLSVGDGTQLGYVTGGGSLAVSSGCVTATSMGEVQNLDIATGASLAVVEAVTINGTFSSEGSLVGDTAITFAQTVRSGGTVAAPRIRLGGNGNVFTMLSASTLEFAGELSTATPQVSVGSFVAPKTRSTFAISVEDTDAEQATYTLIRTETGIDASLFTLSPETLLNFRKNKLQATLSSNGKELNLVLLYSEQGIYVAECHSANGLQGGRLLDEVFFELDPQSAPEQNPDLASLLTALDEAIDGGNAASVDRTAAAAAGASVPALGLALTGDVSRQLRAIRNRTTTMGVDSRYQHPGLPYTNAWINAEGDYRKLDGDGTAAGFSLSSWGGTVGVDWDVAEELTLGFACSALYGDFRSTTVEMAKGDVDTRYATLFGRWVSRNWEHRFVVTGGQADISLDRTVFHGKGSYTTHGETDGTSWGALYELAYTISLAEDNCVCWQPVINASYVHASVDGYTETGSDAALTVGKQDLDVFTVGAGARLQAIVGQSVYNRTSLLELRALAKVDAGDREGSARTAFAVLPGDTASMKSQDYGAVGLELGACLTIPVSVKAGEIFIDASADLRRNYNEVNATVGWRVHF